MNLKTDKIFKSNKKIKVAVGLSGGVDSAVTAGLLKQQGYEVIGLTMQLSNKIYCHRLSQKACFEDKAAKNNIREAKKAARFLGIPHQTIDVAPEFEKYVLQTFRKEYLAGRTPNPCVICNQKIKFGFMLKKALSAGIDFDYFATGHYARIKFNHKTGRFNLYRGKDLKKDQSYFLYRLTQSQLKKILLPLGDYTKAEVKKMAQDFGLSKFANKPESQDFVENGSYAEIIGKAGEKPGQIISTSGKLLGVHNGLVNFTVGQRRGINIGGLAEPYYVIRIDARKNKIIVGKKSEALSKEFNIKKTNWIVFPKLKKTETGAVKIRASADLIKCQIIPCLGGAKIKLKKPAFAVTAGQSAVIYKGDLVLGGGIIQV